MAQDWTSSDNTTDLFKKMVENTADWAEALGESAQQEPVSSDNTTDLYRKLVHNTSLL